jgi:hypothetical protein
MTNEQKECCPRFDPTTWDEKEITWEKKMFMKDSVRTFFHVPLNFGKVMTRVMAMVEPTHALETPYLALNHDVSPWKSDLLLAVTHSVDGGEMVDLSGTFMTKVFEGNYKDMRTWITTMETYVKGKGKEVKDWYFYYTTCPKCAKKYGKNYVVIFAKV